MKTIRDYLDSVIKDIKVDDDGLLSFVISYADDFPAFLGHFPEKKILPAVAMITTISVSLEKYLHKSLVLKEVIRSSFKSLILPDESLNIKIKLLETETNYKASVKVSSLGNKKCDLRLEYKISYEL